MTETYFGPEGIYAFEIMQKLAYFAGKDFKYVMAREIGGFNTMVSMYVSIKKGNPFIDGDGNGYAVPELYPINDIPAVPLVLAERNGDTIAAYIKDYKDYQSAENIGRGI